MKKYLLILMMIFGCCVTVFAQNQDRQTKKDMGKELLEFKLKFLAQEINLKEKQQQKFFDLYTRMWEEKHSVFKEAVALKKKVKDNKNATDADYEAANAAMVKAREMDAAIEKKYDEQFATILTSKQIYQMKNAEEKFRQKLHEMHKKKHKHKNK